MYQRSNFARLLLFILAIAIVAVPLTAQQNYPPNNQQQSTPPSEEPSKHDNQPAAQTGPTTATQPSGEYSRSDTGTPRDRDYDVTHADSRFAWGTLISGLAIGLVVGYLMGAASKSGRPGSSTGFRSDRAA